MDKNEGILKTLNEDGVWRDDQGTLFCVCPGENCIKFMWEGEGENHG